jgi:hypothetical protein
MPTPPSNSHYPSGPTPPSPNSVWINGNWVTGFNPNLDLSGGSMTSDQNSAFGQMAALLDSMGLSSLLPFLKGLILDGITDAASLQLALQDRPEWKARFAGNEMLRKQGLGVLSPGEYLAVERSYAQIMKNYGLPSGFYDEPSDFAKWIGGNVSAAELQQRVSAYSDLAMREDPQVVAQLKSMGMAQGDILAYIMDPERAAPVIQQQYKTTLLGAASRRAGYTADNKMLGQLAARGVTEDQASQGFGLVAQTMGDARTLAQVYGEDYTAADLESEVFDNNAGAAKKRKRLASQERAAFGGSAGNAGISRSTSGSY